MGGRVWVAVALLAVVLGSQATIAHAAFDPQAEARNFSKINERSDQEHGTPAYKALLAQQAIDDELERADIALNDPERDFSGNLCAKHKDGCAGDVRLYRWAQSGYGLTYPVLYVARSGAIISGHIWATRDGPPKRPGIVITTGSVQAPEELYLYAATTLAKKGYVVMTYDVQGQGRSDTMGEDPDQNEGFPAQQPANFIGGTEDALNFFLSTPESNYVPLPSDSSATVHSARQDRRVAEGRNAAFNPAFRLLDPTRIGIVGHSLGASAVSTVCCAGPYASVVDAFVAWDNLSASGVTPRVPALGMSADYGLVPTPFTADPDPQSKNSASHAYSAAGIDTAQINIRGGTHYEFSYIPNPGFGATWRGMDEVAWYTAAWLDKYVKGDPTADARLLTDRWRDDNPEQSIDPDNDGNMFSYYFRSRIDMDLSAGGHVRCENLRDLQGAPEETCGAASVSDDGRPPGYSYVAEAQTPDPKGFARPKSARPTSVALVPAFEPCTAANSTHGAPLAVPSCSPPTPSSDHLTVGTPDVNGQPVRSTGYVDLKPVGESPINPLNGDQADVRINTSLTDVRSSSDSSDYTGELRAVVGLRITDRNNDNGTTGNEGASVTDVPLSFNIPCSATPGPEGGACNLATTADAVIADVAKEGQRAVWELGKIQVFDGGADGDGDTAGDNTLFAVQGLLTP